MVDPPSRGDDVHQPTLCRWADPTPCELCLRSYEVAEPPIDLNHGLATRNAGFPGDALLRNRARLLRHREAPFRKGFFIALDEYVVRPAPVNQRDWYDDYDPRTLAR